jgi:hypothetical protein
MAFQFRPPTKLPLHSAISSLPDISNASSGFVQDRNWMLLPSLITSVHFSFAFLRDDECNGNLSTVSAGVTEFQKELGG